MDSRPTTSVIIVNFNNFSLLRSALDSIPQCGLENFEVIVVDNASSEGDIRDVARAYPQHTFIPLSENVGFAKGNNIGAARAKGTYFLFLNNDAELTPGGWDQLPKLFSYSHLAVIQPTITIAGSRLINNTGLDLNYLGFAWNKNYEVANELKSADQLIAFSGAAVVIKAAVFNEMQGFNEMYFMYHEDVDLSLRIVNAGYGIQFRPEVTVAHHYRYKSDPKRYYFLERNRLLTLLRNYPIWALLVMIPAFIYMELGMLAYSIRGHWFLKKIASYRDIFIHLPQVMLFRKKEKNRTFSFVPKLVGAVKFTEINNFALQYLANPVLAIYWKLVKPLLSYGH